MDKPNCYDCKYKGSVVGSAHSSCHHPAFESQKSALGMVVSILASAKRVPVNTIISQECKVKGNSHGIKSGWFNHPWNFDPVWLEECNGFKDKNTGMPVQDDSHAEEMIQDQLDKY